MRILAAALAGLLAASAPAAAHSPELRAAFADWKAGRAAEALPKALAAARAEPASGWPHLLLARVQITLGDGLAAAAELDRAEAAGLPRAITNHLRAHALLLEGRPEAAIAAAEPADVAPRFRGYAARVRGRALLALGAVDEAGAAFDAARSSDPLDVGAWVDTATQRSAVGDLRGSIAAADRAVAIAPGDIAALIAKGDAARTQYGLIAALPWYERALAIDPRNIDALLARAATEGDLGRARAMLATTRAVLAIDGGNGEAFFLQAVLAARGRAFALSRRLLDRVGEDIRARPAAMLLDGVIACRTGNPQQAITQLRRLVEMQPGNLVARRVLAVAAWATGDAWGVIEVLTPVADEPWADSHSLTLIGRALERTGNRVRAAAYLDRAAAPRGATERLGVEPLDRARLAGLRAAAAGGQAEARVALIRALARSGAGDEALAEAMALRDANPGVPATHLVVGDVLSAGGRHAQAVDSYRAAANIAFTEPVALRLIAALRRSGQEAAGRRVLGLHLAQNPNGVAARRLEAEALLAAGRWREAARGLERLRRRIGARDAVVEANLAWAAFALGRRDLAVAAARAAHRLVPGSAAASMTYGWLLHASGRDRRRGLALLRQAAAQAATDPRPRRLLARALAAGRQRTVFPSLPGRG